MRTFRALMALSALCLGSSAQAQVFFDGYAERWREAPIDRYERFSDTRPLDREDIRDQLMEDGFQVLSLRPDRGDWIADVRDPSGRRLRLIVDGFDGRILRRVETSTPPQPRTPPPRTQTTPRVAPAPAPPQTAPAPAPTPPPATAPVPSAPTPQPEAQSAPTQPPRVIPLYNKPE